MAWAARLQALLARHWWRAEPTLLMQLLRPLSWFYGTLARRAAQRAASVRESLPVPVLVVGNLIAGGAGKTPTVLALVQALQQAGWRPGVISRGHGRRGHGVQTVQPDSSAADVGDEPLLIKRRSGVPVWVGRARVEAARALCRQHPDVNVLLSDDGLQHAALPRVLEVIVFDERGAGNGLLLPAGPLREPVPRVLQRQQMLLYNAARPSTALPGALAQRRLTSALELADWLAGRTQHAVELPGLRGRELLAVAGIAAPERFFSMLRAAGLTLRELALDDHHAYHADRPLPWPAGTPELVTTEKDAVKLSPAALGNTRVWVVGLDLQLPPRFIDTLLQRLQDARATLP